jgi:hypothetical protein
MDQSYKRGAEAGLALAADQELLDSQSVEHVTIYAMCM